MNAKRILTSAAVFGLFTLAGCMLMVMAAPRLIMIGAMNKIGDADARVNTMLHNPPITKESRRVVRPSPDLLYSLCVYDLSAGAVEIHMSAFSDYQSLSLYDARTDNFFTINDRAENGPAATIIITRPGVAAAAGDDAVPVVVSPSAKGIALIRRLAGSGALLEEALSVRAGDYCAPVDA